MGERARNRCRDRLRSLATAALDPEEARLAAIEELRRAIGFERWCWPLTDPDSGLAMSGIARFDLWPTLPRLISLQEHGDVASKPRLMVGPRASVALSEATAGDMARSPLWRECLHPYGIGDTLMTACRERDGCWGTVELMRDRDDRPFDPDEVGLLDELAPTLGTLLRRSLALSWRDEARDTAAPPPSTLIIDRAMAPIAWTASMRDWLDQLAPTRDLLPPAIYEIGTRILARAEADAGHQLPARVRIRTSSAGWTVVEGARLEGADDARVAITVRNATADEVADLLCSAYALTPRERQLVALLRGGLATRQVSQTLGISAYTVQDHLKAIFAKAGVRSRRELMSHVLDSAPPAAPVTERPRRTGRQTKRYTGGEDSR